MNSPLVTPFRWYDKFYKQNRYDVDCGDSCLFKLITDRGHLLPFQFTREPSVALIDSWILRSACIDPDVLTDPGDIELDKTLLQLFNIGAHDFIIYIGSSLGISIPPGDYFSIIESGSEVFYSEVITVKDFIPSKSNYHILEWVNTCDIQDVIYSTGYKNRLYIDEAVITKPEYPFLEQGEEDGNKNFIAKFQLWEKQIHFIVAKVPEFISDALTLLPVHDTIELTPPLRNEQLQETEAISIQAAEAEISYVVNDCFQTVNLKMLLEDKYIDSACCDNNIITACEPEEEGVPSATMSWGSAAFHFYGSAYPNSYVQIEYSNDGGATWLLDPQIVNASVYNLLGVHIPYPERYDGFVIKFRMHNYTLNCEYGYTDVMTYTFPGECEVRTIDTGANRTLSDGTFRTLSPC